MKRNKQQLEHCLQTVEKLEDNVESLRSNSLERAKEKIEEGELPRRVKERNLPNKSHEVST